MIMFRTKRDVDRHVQELFRKLKGENERKHKYFNIARLYFQVGDYETARRYVSSFLSIRDDSASAHKLYGQTLEALGQKENALAEYKCSLILESNQPDLILKVCELMGEPSVKLDLSAGKYWCERAEHLFPHHSSVFKLKEKLVSGGDVKNSAELEKLIEAELVARPKDVSLHIKLLRLYLESGRIKEAYNTALEVEMRFAFREELKWYECLADVFQAYAEANKPCGWEFYLEYTCVLERTACLNLQEQYGSPRRSWAQGVNALFNFDQILETATSQTVPSSDATPYLEFLKHQRAQLCFHFATALFKKAKKEPSSWREVSRAVAPLLLHALVPPVDLKSPWVSQTSKARRKCLEWWAKEAAFRYSQAGHIIISLLTERRSHFLERVTQFCCGNWRERLYQKLFLTRDQHQSIGSSHLVGHEGFAVPPLIIPSATDLKPYNEAAQRLHPSSLHHFVWLGLRELNRHRGRGGPVSLGADFRCLVFEDLQVSCSNLSIAGPETLCQLDIDAFLYAAVICSRASLDDEQTSGYRSSDKPQVLPANITEYLCTIAQAKWWNAVFRVYTNQARADLGEVRQTLQRGVEVIRVLGNHGLDVRLVVQLARIFTERAAVVTADQSALEERAALYWTCSLPLLEKLQRSQAVRAPNARLFEYQGRELSSEEIRDFIEEGQYFLACQMMKEGKHEKAVEAFQQLKLPYASFHQAMIYKKLAAQELQELHGEHITSEMRSRHIILLTKVRECLYLTLDRLRSPGVDRKHPLNAELSGHIEEIESQLGRIDSDVWRSDLNRNDMEGGSDGTVSSGPSAEENGNSVYGYNNSFVHLTPRHLNSGRFSSTPYRSHNHRDGDTSAHDRSRRTEARPSPERLDAQMRYLMHGRDSLTQQMQALLEVNRNMAESLEELKGLIQELIKKDTHKRSESQINSDLPHMGDAEDDLYVFEEDYSEDVNVSASHLAQYQPFPQYPGYAGTAYRPLSGMMGSNAVAYGPAPGAGAGDSTAAVPPQLLPPGAAAGMSTFFRNVDPALMYPQTLSYYSQGALPFSEGQQLPDFRAPPPIPGSVFSRLGAAPPPAPVAPVVPDPSALHSGAKIPPPVSQAAPVNVVITSSDTLPTTVPPTQPTLSVTIPPQHRLGTPLVHAAVPPAAVAAVLPQAGMPPIVPVIPAGVPPSMVPAGATIGFPAVPPATLQPHLGLSSTLPLAAGVSMPIVTAAVASGSVPHAFQITMPPQAQVPVASRLEKGAAALSPVLPISTQTLLQSVPSPVYSAVGMEKTGKELPSAPAATTSTTSVTTPTSAGVVKASPSKPIKAHRVSTGSAAGSEDGAAEEVEHDPCPDFQPVIPLPAEVELTTGEEEEITLFECRCKLFRFVDKEWKERGVGQLKILHHKTTGKVRMLMRREQVLKVCANHFLAPDMSLSRMSDKAWIWAANDFADEQVRLEKLCARFKTVDEAINFAEAFDNACKLSKGAKTTPIKDFSKRSETMGTLTPSSSNTSSISSASSPATMTPSTSPGEKFTLGGFSFLAPPKLNPSAQKNQVVKEAVMKEKDKTGSTPAKPSPFASFSFSTPKSPPTTDTKTPMTSTLFPSSLTVTSTPHFGKPSVGQALDLSKPLSSSTTLFSSQTGKDKAGQKDSSAGGEPLMFQSASNVPTFSTLAQVAPETLALQKSTTFKGFEGAGSPLFASATPSASHKKDSPKVGTPATGGGDDDTQEFVPTQEFAPVVPLPELVDIKTGEEGEEVLFQERSKLLRFDSDTRQWKERGVGNFKILKHPQTGRVRLLMRREQVLKVCCNHTLTAAMNFTALSTSDRAWSWYAQDFSEGEVKPELLALKFKTTEQAQAFGSKIKELQSEMVNNQVPGGGAKPSAVSGPAPEKPSSSPPSLWKCSKCTFPNLAEVNTCHKCNAVRLRPRADPDAGVEKPSLSELFKAPAGSWECPQCYTRNVGTKDLCVCCSEIRPNKTTPKSKAGGAWECKTCFSRNDETERRCSSCSSEKPTTATPTKQNGPSNTSTKKPLSELFKPKAGSWECQGCFIRNEATVIQCPACSTPQPGHEDAVKKREAEQHQPPPGFSFSFGIPKQADSGKDAEKEESKPSLGFTFGVPAASQQTTASTWTYVSSASTTTTSLIFGTSAVTLTSAHSPSPTQSSVITSSTTSSNKTEVENPIPFESKPAPFQFGTSVSDTKPFSFGVKDSTPKTESQEPPAMRNFVFGSPQSFKFNFSGIRPKSPVKSPKSPGVIGASGGEDDSGSEPEEDEGEHIFFQPVIPLPDKVPVHTGEEEEELLYSQRAKLFRFVDGMWKERGLGDIKILKHKKTEKIRLLMRREHVLKICLNHFLTTDIKFMEKDEKSWMWFASDFSEGELQEEKFAIRFQKSEIAVAFKEAIEKAQATLGSPAKTETTSAAASAPALKSKEFSGDGSASTPFAASQGAKGVARLLFGSPPAPSADSSAPQDPSPSEDDVQVVYEVTVTPEERAQALELKLSPNFYAYRRKPGCPGCPGCEPDSDSEEAEKAAAKAEAEKPSAPTTTVSTSTSGSIFSSSSSILPPTTQPSTFAFSIPATPLAATTNTPTSTSTVFGQAPSSVQNKGFPFGSSQTSKSILGSSSTPVTSTPSAQNKAFNTFSFSPSENKDIKAPASGQNLFSSPSTMNTGSIFGGQTGALLGEQISASTVSNTGPLFAQNTTSGGGGSIFGGTSIFGGQSGTPVGPAQNTSASATSFFGLSTTPTFGPKTGSFFGQGTTKSDTPSIFGGTISFASATPVFGLQTTTGPSSTTTAPNASIIFSSFNVPQSQDSKPTSAEPPHPDQSTEPVNLSQRERGDQQVPKEQTEEGVPFLPTDTSLTFSSLATQTESQKPAFLSPADTSKSFSWAGAGAQVFGSAQKAVKSEPKDSASKKGTSKDGGGSSDEEEGGAGVDDSHDPHFEPIVALPEAIELRTGEEDEEKVFCQRAKLYRFESDLHEWKERGVGEMKILKDPQRGTYRLLLRREQVHKIVLNQRMTPDLTLSSLLGSEVSWCWGGMNFAHDESTGELRTEPKLEKLAVRFKNVDLAREFETIVKQCVAELAAKPPAPTTPLLPESVTEPRPAAARRSTEESEEERNDGEDDYEDDDDNDEGEEEDDEDEEDDDDDDDESEKNLMFEKRATLEAKDPAGGQWVNQGMGVLQIVYDRDLLVTRVIMVADGSHKTLCNTIIAENINLEVHNKDCIWTAKDFGSDPMVVRTFKARFSSETAAEEFRRVLEEILSQLSAWISDV